uniref:L-gulonolactone oxidase n=1 Tax=Callorhinchus milii TaxID=7868 RepID=A0A4W3GXX2_CALMI
MEGHRFLNWAKTYSCEPELYFEPTSVEEVRQILLLAKQRCKRVKVVGEGHSPSDIACTEGYLIKLNKLNRLLKVDVMKQQVTVEAGILLTELNEDLTQHGLALSNMGAVSDVTAGGVIATGTHNTGIRHGILATQVVSLCLMTAAGEVLECSEQQNQEVFRAASLHLGCLGVVLTLTIQCQPAFLIHQRRFPASLTQVHTPPTPTPSLAHTGTHSKSQPRSHRYTLPPPPRPRLALLTQVHTPLHPTPRSHRYTLPHPQPRSHRYTFPPASLTQLAVLKTFSSPLISSTTV